MLSFLAGRNNENSTLMIMNVDGTERRQVVTIEAVGGPGSLISDVDFTPDSEKLVLSVLKEAESMGTTDLYAIDIDGGNLVQLTHMDPDQNCYVIEFSPKGW
ncbi:MAG TPA: hypothetical protein GXZ67_00020 [Clostridiaceae bacterium]|jgi:Tol biopolymer transport system component|nr:hypothetical protein [Clostridiaceae bacterium]